MFASCIRGHHISKAFWTPTIGETLCCEKESGNAADPYAVAVVLSSEKATTVGHVQRKISAASNLFLRQDGSSIRCGYGEKVSFSRFTSRRYGGTLSGSNVYKLRRIHCKHPSNPSFQRLIAFVTGELSLVAKYMNNLIFFRSAG